MAMETEKLELDMEKIEETMSYLAENKELGYALLAKNNDEVVGSLYISFFYNIYTHQREYWFESVFIEEKYRGKGIFKKMF
jgi:RimJ/RimL family protein N-acetyltransferase